MNYLTLIDGAYTKAESAPEFSAKYDVVVAGLGASGSFCALSAAEEGASVLGIERGNGTGGMATVGTVNGYYYGGFGGKYEEIDAECNTLRKKVFMPYGAFHPDAKQYVMEKRLVQAGVKISYCSIIVGLFEENNQIVGVRMADECSIVDVRCGMLVDGTSDGHLIRMCGVATAIGREIDGEVQPFTSSRVYFSEDGRRIIRTNSDSGVVNQYDDEDFSKATLIAHAAHAPHISGTRRFLYLAQQIGVREGIRFEGEAFIGLKEVLNDVRPEDTLLYAYSDLDRHGQDYAFDDMDYQDFVLVCNFSTVNVTIPVPIGSMVPKGKKGIISIGRCLSMDSYVASAVRMNRDMYRMGEAAGVLAAMTADAGDARGVDMEILKEKLDTRKCRTSYLHTSDYAFSDTSQNLTAIVWPKEFDEAVTYLKTICPGVGFRACQKWGKEVVGDKLTALLNSGDELLRYNAAIALGAAGDCRALPLLRELVKNRKIFFFEDSRRTNQLRHVIAIYLLGRLGDTEIISELISMLSAREYERPLYHELTEPSYKFSVTKGFNGVYFDNLSNAVTALRHIAEANPDRAAEIDDALKAFANDESYIRRITNESFPHSEYKKVYRIKERALGQAH